MKFIYVFDKVLKDKLLSKGFYLIKEDHDVNGTVWIFENKGSLSFSLIDKGKYAFSNSLAF